MRCSSCGYLNKGGGNCEMCDTVMTIPQIKLKIKEENLKSLEKELDRVFSIFIRTRDMDPQGIVKCFTCGKYAHWRTGGEMHCGHYVSRINKPLRWHEQNCNVQCYRCNVELKGNYPAYAQAMIRKYGPAILDQLDIIKNNIWKADRSKLKIMIKYYSKKIEHIKL